MGLISDVSSGGLLNAEVELLSSKEVEGREDAVTVEGGEGGDLNGLAEIPSFFLAN